MLTPDYQNLWDTLELNHEKIPAFTSVATRLTLTKERYEHVGMEVCPDNPVPWTFIAICHYMEGNQNFRTHLYNGDPLTARTVHYPPGRPKTSTPPFTWEFSAADALRHLGYSRPQEWGIVDLLREMEEWNGLGYRAKDIYTPYLWSYTNHYSKGKFKEIADGKGGYKSIFDPELVSGQLGAAGVLKSIITL